MSKENITIESKVMEKVLSGEIKMKPKWYFVLGSFFSIAGLTGLFISTAFLFNLFIFTIRRLGTGRGYHRIIYMLDNFPLWIPIVGLVFLIFGIILLKRFDFSYKKNFRMVVLWFIASVIFCAHEKIVSAKPKT